MVRQEVVGEFNGGQLMRSHPKDGEAEIVRDVDNLNQRRGRPFSDTSECVGRRSTYRSGHASDHNDATLALLNHDLGGFSGAEVSSVNL